MLVTQIKPEEEILPKISKKRIFIFECLGCNEVYFPKKKAENFIDKLKKKPKLWENYPVTIYAIGNLLGNILRGIIRK
mgnify:CR=1 FL=1